MKTSVLISSILLTGTFALGLHQGAIANNKADNPNESSTMGEAVSDGMITTKVKAELVNTKDLKSTDISVETNNGITTLTGTVPSDAELKKAIAATSSIKGVSKVNAEGLTVKANN